MDDKQFEALVRQLEQDEMRSPEDHKARVILLALLGYGYIALVLAVLLGLLVATVMIMARAHTGGLAKIALALIVAAWFILRALRVRFEPPQGRALTRADAPALFTEAHSIAQALRAPHPDVVLLTTEYNASVTQIPRLGMLGFSRNYLCIGAPLLAALPKEHVRAVLAHEFAHLSHAHGKFGSWCYRVRVTWFQLLDALEREQHWSAGIFRRFFRWYVPYFSAYTVVLMRRHEFEADILAAEIVGPLQMAQTLVDIDVRGDSLSRRFWTTTWQSAKEQAAPPADIYARLAATTLDILPAEFGADSMAAAWSRETAVADSHPALRERVLQMMDDEFDRPGPSPTFADVAATTYLAPNHERLLSEMSASWEQGVANHWAQQHNAFAESRNGLAALAARPQSELSRDERIQFASWTEDLHGTAPALPLFEALYASDATDPIATYAVGRLRLDSGDESGIDLLEAAMAREPNAIIPGCNIAADFCERRQQPERAARFRQRGAERQELMESAMAERRRISEDDMFVPSDLPREVRPPIVQQLDTFPAIQRAFLVKKIVEHFETEAPMHVLAVHVSGSLVTSASELRAAAERVTSSLTVPDNVHVFVLTDTHRKLLKPLSAVAGSLLYNGKARKAERRAARKT